MRARARSSRPLSARARSSPPVSDHDSKAAGCPTVRSRRRPTRFSASARRPRTMSCVRPTGGSCASRIQTRGETRPNSRRCNSPGSGWVTPASAPRTTAEPPGAAPMRPRAGHRGLSRHRHSDRDPPTPGRELGPSVTRGDGGGSATSGSSASGWAEAPSWPIPTTPRWCAPHHEIFAGSSQMPSRRNTPPGASPISASAGPSGMMWPRAPPTRRSTTWYWARPASTRFCRKTSARQWSSSAASSRVRPWETTDPCTTSPPARRPSRGR